MKRKLLAVFGLVALAVAVTTGIAVATSDTPVPPPAPQAAVVPAELSAHFGVLKEGTTSTAVANIASPGVDSKTVEGLNGMSVGLDEQFGLNASFAREVTYKAQHVWVVPGSKGICIHDFDTGQGTCGPIANAIAGTLQLDVGGNEAGGGTIYGLVANGNPTVVVHDANGSTETVPVEHNVYIIEHPGTKSVGLIGGTGQTTVTVPK